MDTAAVDLDGLAVRAEPFSKQRLNERLGHYLDNMGISETALTFQNVSRAEKGLQKVEGRGGGCMD